MALLELPDEPHPTDPNSVELIFRLPVSGSKVKRRFLRQDKVEVLYAYIDYLNSAGECSFEAESQSNLHQGHTCTLNKEREDLSNYKNQYYTLK